MFEVFGPHETSVVYGPLRVASREVSLSTLETVLVHDGSSIRHRRVFQGVN